MEPSGRGLVQIKEDGFLITSLALLGSGDPPAQLGLVVRGGCSRRSHAVRAAPAQDLLRNYALIQSAHLERRESRWDQLRATR